MIRNLYMENVAKDVCGSFSANLQPIFRCKMANFWGFGTGVSPGGKFKNGYFISSIKYSVHLLCLGLHIVAEL